MILRDTAASLGRRAWESPTLTSWASLAARALDLAVVLPLVLRGFGVAEIAVWHLFLSVLFLQLVVETGLNTTFVRVTAYALGGARSLHAVGSADATGEPNLPLLSAIWQTLHRSYLWLACGLALLTITLGTVAMVRPLESTSDSATAWAAWWVLALASPIALRGGCYAVFLQGLGRVALFRRWEALSLLGGAAASAAVLAVGGSLLWLVAVRQGWALATVALNRWLLGRTPEHRALVRVERKSRVGVMAAVWPSAWRSSLGVAMSAGLVELSGIVFAQLGSSAEVAAYLVSLKLLQALQQFSAAPFYSQLPLLARLHSERRRDSLVEVARRGMSAALSTFAVGFVTVGTIAPWVLEALESNARFVGPGLWLLMGWAFFVERYGAMHLQLFSTTNRIVWHVANGVSGAIYLAVALALYRQLGIAAFPLGTVAGNLGFYTWYSARLSYKAFGLRLGAFEKTVLLSPLMLMIAYTAIVLARG